eukprot:COSAG06_NODE_3417_length_5373_cov_163.207622_4_plen_401_part_00
MHELEFTCDEAYLNAMIVKFGHKKKKEGGKGSGKGVVGFEEFQTIVALIAPSLAQAAEVKAKEAEAAAQRKAEEAEGGGGEAEEMPAGLSKMQQMAWKKKKGKNPKKAKGGGKSATASGGLPGGNKPKPKPKPAAAAEQLDVYVAAAPFPKEQEGDLALQPGDRVVVLAKDGDWWSGYLESDAAKARGNFPGAFVEKQQQPAAAAAGSAASAPSQKKAAAASASSDGSDVFVAVAPFAKEQEGDLALQPGDRVVVLAKDGDWWSGYLESDETKAAGNFPGTFVELAAETAAGPAASPAPAPQPSAPAAAAAAAPAAAASAAAAPSSSSSAGGGGNSTSDTTYTLAQMTDRSFWEGLDLKEQRWKYLPDDAFASELGMEKATFDAMPKWKQTKALKKAELF